MAHVARIVRAQGATADLRTLKIEQPQVLIEMENSAEAFHQHILHHRLPSGSWITSDADGELALDDLTELDVIPLGRDAPYPVAGRPFRIPPEYSDAAWRTLTARALQLAQIHGFVAPTATIPGTAVTVDGWYYSDTALASFGTEVTATVVGTNERARIEGRIGLFKADLGDTDGDIWRSAERVLKADYPDWLAAKRSGAGRDKRLLRCDKRSDGKPILLRDASKLMDATAVLDARIFDGPPALAEVLRSVETSGVEDQGWGQQYVANSGMSPKSGLAVEFMQLVYNLFYLICHDLLDGRHCSAAEHVARRILQIQKAVKRNPKSPDFEGLEVYCRHMTDSSGSVFAPTFDKHVAEIQKAAAVTLKQDRLNREEEGHEKTRRQKKKDDP